MMAKERMSPIQSQFNSLTISLSVRPCVAVWLSVWPTFFQSQCQWEPPANELFSKTLVLMNVKTHLRAKGGKRGKILGKPGIEFDFLDKKD